MDLAGVTFDLLVEPLIFGMVPFSAWPTVIQVILMGCAGWLFATRVVLPKWIDPLLEGGNEKAE